MPRRNHKAQKSKLHRSKPKRKPARERNMRLQQNARVTGRRSA